MKKNNTHPFILSLYELPQTVFTTNEIAIILNESDLDRLKSKINYYTKNKKIIRLRKGLYAKKDYNIFEVSTKIYVPSYISLETVLQKEGIIFQYYHSVFLVSYLSRRIKCADYEFIYRKIKNEILLNPEGIITSQGYAIASKERAFLDAIYLYKEYHFDNLSVINWEKTMEIARIYNSKSLVKRLNKYYLQAKNA